MERRRFGNIEFIPGQNGGRYPFSNSIFIDDGEKALIDAGSDKAFLKTIAPQIKWLINSHYHEDHIGFNYLFPEAQLLVHQEDAPCFKSIDNFLSHYGLTGTEYEKDWRDIILNQYKYHERESVFELNDGDTLRFGRTVMEVIHTPGHTSGHCSFWFPDEGVLFLSDLDMTDFGPWYGDRVADIDQTIASVAKLLKIPAQYYITSHEKGIMTGSIEGLADAYLDVIRQRDERLRAFIGKKPRTQKEIIDEWLMYGKPREPLIFFKPSERALVLKHLERAVSLGVMEYKDDRYSLL